MAVISVDSLDDPRLAAYRDLKERELARDGGRFIAEGENVVRRLLKSPVAVDSVLIARRKREIIEPLVAENIPVYCADDELIARTFGFEFHSGVMACGIRPASLDLAAVVPATPLPAVVVVCQEIANAENMGGLIRISAAFGACAMVLGERCCDPFFRQSVRVSMGTIFSLPIVRSENLLADLDWLGRAGRMTRVAAVLADDAERLASLKHEPRVAVVFGSEGHGLDSRTIGACDRRVTIPMKLGTDSLNVAVAAAVFLYHLTLGK
jgi:tRNA G18 (ribose-2'-O)-methylase SpoU